MPNHHHRAGGLHQVNKKNKRTKSSKRSASRIAGGKIEGRRAAFKQRLVAHNRADRRHIQQQKRDAKRQELVRKKRGIGNGPAPPRIVGVISLGESEDTEERLRSLILGEADEVFRTQGDDDYSTITAKYNAHKKDGNLTVLTNKTAFRSQYANQNNNDDAAVLAALDLCRVCDVIMFVIDGDESKSEEDFIGMNIGGGGDDKSHATNKTSSTAQDWDHLISERGDRILGAIKGQGIPRAVTVYARTEKDVLELGEDHMTTQSAKSLRRANIKRKADLKKYISRFATTEFGVDNDKVIEVNMRESENNQMEADDVVDPSEHSKKILAAALVRSLCTMSASPAKWVSQMPRAYILSDNHKYDPDSSELHLTGYVRGPVPFDVNSLVHIPNLGTYACKCTADASKPGMRTKKQGQEMSTDQFALESDPMKREPLEKFAAPDALDGEQNLVGFDEADEEGEDLDQDGEEGDGQNFLRPAGWSDYQSAWLDVVDNDGVDADDFDHGELAKELNKKSSASVAPDSMDLDDANRISEEERQALIEQRRKDQQDHQEFPDEVQVNEDDKARDRFARYRSLKSFRKSYWDPKENLPDTYASIYNFSSFKTTQRSVMADMKDVAKEAQTKADLGLWGKPSGGEDAEMRDDSDDEDEDLLEGCVPSGSYITLTIEGVSKEDFATLPSDALLSCVGLLPHENKVSVLHMGLSHATSHSDSSEVPVKSKDLLTFRCGWRTWTGRPIFYQNNLNCDKHKFERFMPQAGGFFAASVFGPVTYTPSPILVFRQREGRNELVATGSMIGPDADRIIVKRIILTGYPVRVHKRFATVKYMFYDPEDVKWFQPAGLTTKHGLNGKIEESVGEHGTMKCLFNAPIKQHDTVCLALYKRVYPKFVEKTGASDDVGTVRSIRAKTTLVVK